MRRSFLLVFVILIKSTMSFLRTNSIFVKTWRSMSSLTSPKYFNKTFKMPPRTDVFPLELLNAHPNDTKVSFQESRHVYSYEGREIKTSVTKLVDSFFDKFNPDEAVEKMMNGPNWPRPAYMFPDGKVYTREQVLKKWDDTGLYAKNRGTWMHYNIERYFNQLETANDIPEMEQFLNFYEDEINSRSIKPYRTEWRIVAPDLNIAGSVDFVGQMPDGSYCIMDWKRAKNLAGSLSNSYGQTALEPLNNLESCDAVKYSLQLNMYKYILEKYYDISISQMTVATFHPLLEKYFMLRVPDYKNEIELVVNKLEQEEQEQHKE